MAFTGAGIGPPRPTWHRSGSLAGDASAAQFKQWIARQGNSRLGDFRANCESVNQCYGSKLLMPSGLRANGRITRDKRRSARSF